MIDRKFAKKIKTPYVFLLNILGSSFVLLNSSLVCGQLKGNEIPQIPSLEMDKLFTNQSAMIALVLLSSLIILVLALAILGSVSQSKKTGGEFLKWADPLATNLFLKVSVLRMGDATISKNVYIRTLGLKFAELVSEQSLKKGDQISLDLGSLPDFPTETTYITGTVTSVSSLDGSESYWARVRFAPLQSEDSGVLSGYLNRLANHKKVVGHL